jgi:hypothetical protein
VVRFYNAKDRFKLEVSLPGNTTGQVYLPFDARKAVVKMNGNIVKAIFADGYYLVQNVKPGKHSFEVFTDNRQ